MTPKTISYFIWNNLSIISSDTHQQLLCNEQIVPLTPTEYRICRLFLKQQAQYLSLQGDALRFPYIQKAHLQSTLGIPNHQLLRKHISNANAKLAPYRLHIRSFTPGYVLLHTDLLAPPSNGDTEDSF